jgi:hypothetical protein
MADRFDFDLVYDDTTFVNKYTNASGIGDKFLETCHKIINESDFPNIEFDIEEFVTGGMFFNKEKTKMLQLSFTKSEFKKLGVFFRAQQFGNVVVFSKFETLEKGFWDAVTGKGKSEILANIRSKCKNVAQYEEYLGLVNLGSLVFSDAMISIDPNYEKRQQLYQLGAKKD